MSATVEGALRAATARLAGAGIPGAAREARLLMAEALCIAPDRLVLHTAEPIPPAALRAFQPMVSARLERRPLAQILGRRWFWGRSFEVSRDVLDPRPETEILVARALEGAAPRRILDLGTGSGAILLTLLTEWPQATGVGTDISAAALGVAVRNAARHDLSARTQFLCTDWAESVAGSFDLVVCNPPYIPEGELAGLAPEVRRWEPQGALSPGPTGLEAYRHLAGCLGGLCAPDARALFEIGAGQAAAVSQIFAAHGFGRLAVHPDLDGRDRVIAIG